MTPPPSPRDVDAWIENSRKGDEQAFRKLYDHYVARLFRFLNQFGGTREDVREWTQRAFVRAYERLDQFDGRSSFSTWLFRIGLNEMRSDVRRSKIIDFEPESDHHHLSSGEDSSDAFTWQSTMRQWLDDLDDLRRRVFVMYEVEGFSHKEIGEALGITESHSRTLLTRTKSYLRQQWEGERKAQ